MKTSRKTAGVTLVVTVLIVMLLLAAVVVVTGQLALSARRSSADQDATVQAQYVAESGLARSQAQLGLVSSLLSPSNISVPLSVTSTIMQTKMLALCGLNSLPSGVGTSGAATFCSANDKSKGMITGALGINQLDLFSFVRADAFPNSGYQFDATGVNAAKSPADYWAQLMGQNGLKDANNNPRPGIPLTGTVSGGTVSSNVGLTLQSVERDASGAYIVKLSVPGVTAQGKNASNAATRQLSAQTAASTYALTFARGSLAKYALLTNHHTVSAAADAACASNPNTCSRVTFTSNTLFSGPVHTNENFLFQGTPYFGGQVTSAGCPATSSSSGAISTTNAAGDVVCAGTPTNGAYTSLGFTKSSDMSNPQQPVLCASKDSKGNCINTNPQFLASASPAVTWNAKYEQLPQSSSEQVTAAQAGGLYLSGSVSNIDLSVQSGVTLSGRSVPEKVQMLSYTQGSGTTNLAITSDKKVYILVGGVWKPAVQVNGVWIDASLPTAISAISGGTAQASFNGVVFVDGSVTSLKGPARPSSNTTNADNTPPALADFSQITIAAKNDIHIKSDLKYESSPCSGKNAVVNGTFTSATCSNKTAANILGVYSTDGDVALDSPADSRYTNSGVPKDVKIEAVLMASKGSVRVDGYDQGAANASLGQVNLTGGIIENYYGAFGITDGRGFGRNFVYDERTGDGLAPPSFPTQAAWTGDLADIRLDGTQFQQKASN